jgi:hypothetical protein
LSSADAAAVDAMVEGEGRAVDGARQARVAGWLKALDGAPMPEPAGDLAARTLAAVERETQKEKGKTQNVGGDVIGRVDGKGAAAHRAGARWAWRRRMAEVGAMAVAACLLLTVTLVAVGQARVSARRTACAGNLKGFGGAFATYAGTRGQGELPMLAMPANGSWLHGDTEGAAGNNAANLLPLVTGQMLEVKALFCPGGGMPEGAVTASANAMPRIGYSYTDMYAKDKPKWGSSTTIVLGDKNPIFGEVVRPDWADRNSANHERNGNYLLHGDGSISWEGSPNAGPGHDNIWSIGSGKERVLAYTGKEVPVGVADVFLCP